MEHLENSPVTATEIRKTTARDPVLACILQNVQSRWPDECGHEELKPYWSRRTELSTQQGCLLWGSRVVVPSSLRESMPKELHDTHPGVSRMKSLGRMFVWWPGFDQQVEDLVQGCDQSQRSRISPVAAPLHP